MGTWGPKLYQDDLALDVKEEYKEKLEKGMSNEETLKEMLEEYEESIEDIDEAPIFWMVLADTMWNLGRLTKEVKENALREIEKGNNLNIWREEGTKGQYKKRELELEKLKDKLNSPMPEEKKIKVQSNKPVKRKFDWNIGDVYAYQLRSDRAKELGVYGQYLVLRKVDIPDSPGKRISAIAYCQICSGELPKTKEELEKLDYIITRNQGNVRYRYKLEIPTITQKAMKEDMIYIGHFDNVESPPKEYRDLFKTNIAFCLYNNLEKDMLYCMADWNGTSSKPITYEPIIENIMDSQIRFLIREKYYEEKLEIEPKKGSYIQEEPLLYISLVDSMMIPGFVINSAGPLTDEMREKAYSKIAELKETINNQKTGNKEEKIKILEDLEKKIKEFKPEDLLPNFFKTE